MHDRKELLTQTIQAVRASGEIIQDHWDKPRNVTMKGRIDLVTETDIAVEKDLQQRLGAILPQATFLAEESAAEGVLGECTWVIDPVDGTTNFAHKLPFTASSVALWENGEIVLGVVNAPILGECFSAARGFGAWCNDAPIRTTTTAVLDQALLATGFPYSIQDNVDEIITWLHKALFASRGVRRCGAAALDLAFLAAGRFDGFYEIGLKPWDTAAGWLLVEEAGGQVTSLEEKKPFDLYCRGILATNGLLHGPLYDLLK